MVHLASSDDLSEKVRRAVAQRRPITFMIGSAVTARWGQAHGVPGVKEMTQRLQHALGNPPGEPANPDLKSAYVHAVRALTHRQFRDDVNLVVRQAVLEAVHPHRRPSPAQLQDKDFLEALTDEPDAWVLPAGVEALGRLIQHATRAGTRATVITTNFDPLIEVAIRRAGGQTLTYTMQDDIDPRAVRASKSVPVVHIHGHWLGDMLHLDPELTGDRRRLHRYLVHLVRDSLTVVVGYGGWEDAFMRALAETTDRVGTETGEVAWAFYESTSDEVVSTYPAVMAVMAPPNNPALGRVCYGGVDCHKLFPACLPPDRTPGTAPPKPAPPQPAPSQLPRLVLAAAIAAMAAGGAGAMGWLGVAPEAPAEPVAARFPPVVEAPPAPPCAAENPGSGLIGLQTNLPAGSTVRLSLEGASVLWCDLAHPIYVPAGTTIVGVVKQGAPTEAPWTGTRAVDGEDLHLHCDDLGACQLKEHAALAPAPQPPAAPTPAPPPQSATPHTPPNTRAPAPVPLPLAPPAPDATPATSHSVQPSTGAALQSTQVRVVLKSKLKLQKVRFRVSQREPCEQATDAKLGAAYDATPGELLACAWSTADQGWQSFSLGHLTGGSVVFVKCTASRCAPCEGASCDP